MKIGEIARATGSKVETVRYYETIGLLGAPPRTEGNYRHYGREALDRLNFIRRSRALGFSIDDIRQLLDLADDASAPCEAVDDIAWVQLAEVDRKIADLTALRDQLRSLVSGCRSERIGSCRIIEALGAEA